MKPEDVIVVGTQRTVAYALDAKGVAHARTFLVVECPENEARKLRHWFSVIANLGERAANREAFRHERGSIHAFKAFQARVACFRVGNVWLLTHGFTKKTDRWPSSELDRADRIMAEHLARKG